MAQKKLIELALDKETVNREGLAIIQSEILMFNLVLIRISPASKKTFINKTKKMLYGEKYKLFGWINHVDERSKLEPMRVKQQDKKKTKRGSSNPPVTS